MKIGLRVLAALLGLVFLLAGGAKVSGQEPMIEAFTRFGLPIWFMYFIGASEVAAAIGLQIPNLARYAAFGLVPIMLGAVGTHLLFDPVQEAAPAIILTALLGPLIWDMRRQSLAVCRKRAP